MEYGGQPSLVSSSKLLVAYFALPLLTLSPEADILGRKFILMLLIGSIGFAIVRTASLSHEISAAA